MKRNILFLNRANSDIEIAFDWYEDQQKTLGIKLGSYELRIKTNLRMLCELRISGIDKKAIVSN
ncbi:hypothetical protein BH09BAC5_BH09BAC5_18120 [soil metagenome]